MANKHSIKPGDQFGRLTAVKIAEIRKYPSGGSRNFWECFCNPKFGGCGKTSDPINASKLTSGHTQSCGCLKNEFVVSRNRQGNGRRLGRGWSSGILYRQWLQMVHKCTNPKNGEYESYGGRGITVCAEWFDYPTYEEWALTHGYEKDLTLDRRENDQGYNPDNCRWVDLTIQARNRRNNKTLLAYLETKTLAEWAEDARCVVNYATLAKRVKSGKLTPEEMISKPAR